MGAPLPRKVTVVDSEQLLMPGIEKLRAAGVEVTVVPDGTSPIDAGNWQVGVRNPMKQLYCWGT